MEGGREGGMEGERRGGGGPRALFSVVAALNAPRAVSSSLPHTSVVGMVGTHGGDGGDT